MLIKAKSKELNFIGSITVSGTFQVLLLTILTAVAAQVAIPVKPVPFTLQTMIVVLSGALLGSKKGAYSQFLYLLMGISGLPVFAQVPDAAIGIARLFGPTGGYLLAFPAAAYLTGYIVEKNSKYFAVTIAMFLGNALIIISGTSYLYFFWVKDIKEALTAGAVLFSVWTVIKVLAGASVYSA
ncbi:MAG: biotin transporter BioY, partial [Ignavibacteriales bacterium]